MDDYIGTITWRGKRTVVLLGLEGKIKVKKQKKEERKEKKRKNERIKQRKNE